MPDSGGVIHNFQQRRQLEGQLAALAVTTSQAALRAGVQRLAEQYPAEVLLAAVARHLGATSSQLRGGLGELCALLPVEATVSLLRGVAGNRQKNPQERTTAALILDRFLHQPASAALLADLVGADEVSYQSLLEAVEEGEQNRHVLLEYVTQMQEHPIDTGFMVLRLIDRLPPARRAQLLRLIAQDARPQVAHAAIERLAAFAAEAGGEGCLRALHTLSLGLQPDQAAFAERSLRKLQFGGHRYRAPVANGWQALLGPSDASGYSSVWFVRRPTGPDENGVGGADDGIWLGFVLSVEGGILQFSGSEGMERAFLPNPVEPGELVTVRTNSGQNMVLLAAPFDVGRWLVRQSLAAHWGQPTPAPLPDEYKLYNDLLWQFVDPQLPADLAAWWEKATPPPNKAFAAPAVAAAAAVLVDDPAMEGWAHWSTAMWHSIKFRSQQPPAVPTNTLVSLLLRELSRMADHHTLLKAMAAGLRVQTLWYAVYASTACAEHAALLAQATAALPITENPLVALLLQKGLSD